MSDDGLYGSLAYGYDANGNRTSRTLNGTTDTYTYAANTNRLQAIANPGTTRPLTHTTSGELLTDDRGIGQTFAFVHDGERRLKSVSANAAPIATYGHAGLGRRVRKALPDGTHRKYVYDLDGRQRRVDHLTSLGRCQRRQVHAASLGSPDYCEGWLGD